MWVAELIKEDWPTVFRLKTTFILCLKSFITKVLEYKAGLNKRIKVV